MGIFGKLEKSLKRCKKISPIKIKLKMLTTKRQETQKDLKI